MKFVFQPNADRVPTVNQLIGYIATLPKDKPFIAEVTKLVVKRNSLQNRALWGCAYKFIKEHAGYDPETVHTLMCGEFFGWGTQDIFGDLRRVPVRTTTHDEQGNRDVIEMDVCAKFYKHIQRWVLEKSGLDVPDPDPEWFKEKAATDLNLDLVES